MRALKALASSTAKLPTTWCASPSTAMPNDSTTPTAERSASEPKPYDNVSGCLCPRGAGGLTYTLETNPDIFGWSKKTGKTHCDFH
jgi:hypothetical protein